MNLCEKLLLLGDEIFLDLFVQFQVAGLVGIIQSVDTMKLVVVGSNDGAIGADGFFTGLTEKREWVGMVHAVRGLLAC
jgi:hypothetical protein